MLTLCLYNGAQSPEAWNHPDYVDDWKPLSVPIRRPSVAVVYGTTVNVELASGTSIQLEIQDGLIEYNGAFYGDFSVGHKPEPYPFPTTNIANIPERT